MLYAVELHRLELRRLNYKISSTKKSKYLKRTGFDKLSVLYLVLRVHNS